MNLTEKQAVFIDLAKKRNNIFLTGKAGTGKSHALRQLIDELATQRIKVMCLAPTGVAANNIGGQTIHSAFQLSPYGVLTYEDCRYWKTERRKMMNKVDAFIIDEISMVRPDILDAMNWTLIKNGCGKLYDRQIIFVGDMKQLPPVIDDNTMSVLYGEYDGHFFNSAKCFRNIKPLTIELGEVVRQTDTEFIEALNAVRDGNKHPYFRAFTEKQNTGIVLAPNVSTVQRYNEAGLASLEGETFTYTATIEGTAKLQDFSLEGAVNVKDGAKIMYLVNSRNNNLYNGALGVFRMKDGNAMIDICGVLYPLQPVTFTKKEYVLNNDKLVLKEVGSITQIPIKLAYALTIHKAQGLTFDEVTVDLTRPCFQQGQLYVALSRVRTPAGLAIKI